MLSNLIILSTMTCQIEMRCLLFQRNIRPQNKIWTTLNEIRKFDNDVEEQFGTIEELKQKLRLNSEERADNFIDYIKVQKQDIIKLTVYDCIYL